MDDFIKILLVAGAIGGIAALIKKKWDDNLSGEDLPVTKTQDKNSQADDAPGAASVGESSQGTKSPGDAVPLEEVQQDIRSSEDARNSTVLSKEKPQDSTFVADPSQVAEPSGDIAPAVKSLQAAEPLEDVPKSAGLLETDTQGDVPATDLSQDTNPSETNSRGAELQDTEQQDDKSLKKSKNIASGRRNNGQRQGGGGERKKRQVPDIICYEDRSGWKMAVDAENNSNIKSVVRKQSGNALNNMKGIYEIRDIEDLKVNYADETSETIQMKGNYPLIFMARKNWEGRARKVKKIYSKFSYVALIPESCGERRGNPPIERERSIYPGYYAHFFAPNENIAEDGFDNCSDIIDPHERFSLVGKTIFDNHTKGDIFSDIPELKDAQRFEGVSEVHIGSEKQGDDWGYIFDPKEKPLSEILQGKGGWFFVRIYNEDYDLIFSADFRLLPGLSGIKINGNSNWQENILVPDAADGYSSVSIEFVGDGIEVYSKSKDLSHSDNNGLVYQVPPEQQYDKTEWIVKSENGQEIDVRIILPRVWWRRYTGGKYYDWTVLPMVMERKDIHNSSSKDGGIEITIPYFVEKFEIGLGAEREENEMAEKRAIFSDDRSRRFCTIRISEFRDDRAIRNPIAENIDFSIYLRDKIVHIIKISADAPPLANVGSPAVVEPFLSSLTPINRKGKISKGFSKKEVKEAGISHTFYFFVDKRRKSCHNHNVNALKKAEEHNNA